MIKNDDREEKIHNLMSLIKKEDFYFYPLFNFHPSFGGFPTENKEIIVIITRLLSDLLISHFYRERKQIEGISENSLFKHRLLCSLNIGIPIKRYWLRQDAGEENGFFEVKENIIWTERGINLESVIEYGLIKEDELWNEISQIELNLKYFGLAHCNINERNVVYYMGHLKLTNNENLIRFNEKSSLEDEIKKYPDDLEHFHLWVLSEKIKCIEIEEKKNDQRGFNKLKIKLKEMLSEAKNDYLKEELPLFKIKMNTTIYEELKMYIIKNQEIIVMKPSEMLINKFYPNKILVPIEEFTKILENRLYPEIISGFIKEKLDFCLKSAQEHLSEKYKMTFQELEDERKEQSTLESLSGFDSIRDVDQRIQSFRKCEKNAIETFQSRMDRHFRNLLLKVFCKQANKILKEYIMP